MKRIALRAFLFLNDPLHPVQYNEPLNSRNACSALHSVVIKGFHIYLDAKDWLKYFDVDII